MPQPPVEDWVHAARGQLVPARIGNAPTEEPARRHRHANAERLQSPSANHARIHKCELTRASHPWQSAFPRLPQRLPRLCLKDLLLESLVPIHTEPFHGLWRVSRHVLTNFDERE